MSTQYKLEVNKRDLFGKKGMKELRKNELIPGIYYSSDSTKSIPFSISKKELSNASKSGARLYSVKVGGKEQTVLFKDVQYHPVTEEVLHIDIYGIKMDEKIQIKVELRLIGEAVGVIEEGGNLTQPAMEIEVSCLPINIPEFIELDVTELKLGESLHAGAVKFKEGIELSSPEELVVASVIHQMKEEDLVTATEEEDIAFEDGDSLDESEKQEGESSSSENKDDGDKDATN